MTGEACSSSPCSGASRLFASGDRRLGAVGDAGELADQALGQGGVDAGDVLGAVGAGEPQDEGREGARPAGVTVPAVKAGVVRTRLASAGRSSGPGRRLEGVRGMDVGAFRRDQGSGSRWWSWSRRRAASSGRACAVEEVQLDVFDRQLGVFGEDGGQPAGRRIGFDLAGELGDDAVSSSSTAR